MSSHAEQLFAEAKHAELCNHAVQLERDAIKLRERCARLKRQRDWLKLHASRHEMPVKVRLPNS